MQSLFTRESHEFAAITNDANKLIPNVSQKLIEPTCVIMDEEKIEKEIKNSILACLFNC